MPREIGYTTLYDGFAWDLPATYNVGVDICDRHAGDKGRLAVIYDRGECAAERWSLSALKRAPDRFANALRGLGIERGDGVAQIEWRDRQ